MLACTTSTARRTAFEGRSLDTPSNLSIPRRAPNAKWESGPVLDPPPQSFPHRLDVVEGPVGKLAEALDQVVGGAHAAGAGNDHRPVSREDGRLEVAGQLGPSLDLVVGERIGGWRVRFSRQKGVRRGLAVGGPLLLAGLVGPRLDRRALHQRARLALELVVNPRCVFVAAALHT